MLVLHLLSLRSPFPLPVSTLLFLLAWSYLSHARDDALLNIDCMLRMVSVLLHLLLSRSLALNP